MVAKVGRSVMEVDGEIGFATLRPRNFLLCEHDQYHNAKEGTAIANQVGTMQSPRKDRFAPL